MFIIGLKTLIVFARATYNFEMIRCKTQNAKVGTDTNNIDLEFSSKNKSMLLRERVPKG